MRHKDCFQSGRCHLFQTRENEGINFSISFCLAGDHVRKWRTPSCLEESSGEEKRKFVTLLAVEAKLAEFPLEDGGQSSQDKWKKTKFLSQMERDFPCGGRAGGAGERQDMHLDQ